MELVPTRCSPSVYGKPPWIFRGSALYQLHLVKAETARAFIPKQLRLVEAFGYTLGGFFLASYDESPAGVFDELVVIAGLVGHPLNPTPLAWASRVLVSSKEACDHGRRDFGLPSQVARFSKRTAVPLQSKARTNGFLNMIGFGTILHHPTDIVDVHVTEVAGSAAVDLCSIKLTPNEPSLKFNKWMGPMISMSLPSFSGLTEYNPNLLKYSCDIGSRVQVVQPAKVSGPSSPATNESNESSSLHCCKVEAIMKELTDDARNLSISVMLSKPLLALQFNCLKMQVEAPVVVSHFSETSPETS